MLLEGSLTRHSNYTPHRGSTDPKDELYPLSASQFLKELIQQFVGALRALSLVPYYLDKIFDCMAGL